MLAGFTASGAIQSLERWREAYVYTEPCSLSLGGWLPSAAPDLARALDRAAADFYFGNSVGGAFGCGGRAMGSASPTAGLQQHGEGLYLARSALRP